MATSFQVARLTRLRLAHQRARMNFLCRQFDAESFLALYGFQTDRRGRRSV